MNINRDLKCTICLLPLVYVGEIGRKLTRKNITSCARGSLYYILSCSDDFRTFLHDLGLVSNQGGISVVVTLPSSIQMKRLHEKRFLIITRLSPLCQLTGLTVIFMCFTLATIPHCLQTSSSMVCLSTLFKSIAIK